jgi:hypothetical protein
MVSLFLAENHIATSGTPTSNESKSEYARKWPLEHMWCSAHQISKTFDYMNNSKRALTHHQLSASETLKLVVIQLKTSDIFKQISLTWCILSSIWAGCTGPIKDPLKFTRPHYLSGTTSNQAAGLLDVNLAI